MIEKDLAFRLELASVLTTTYLKELMMSKNIPAVQPSDFGRLEGKETGMGWILAEKKFRGVITEHEPWDHVKKAHGCSGQNDATAWARGMNQIITILNSLPEQCSKEALRSAFGI